MFSFLYVAGQQVLRDLWALHRGLGPCGHEDGASEASRTAPLLVSFKAIVCAVRRVFGFSLGQELF